MVSPRCGSNGELIGPAVAEIFKIEMCACCCPGVKWCTFFIGLEERNCFAATGAARDTGADASVDKTVRVFLYIYYWGQVQAGYLRNGRFPRWPPPNFGRSRLGHRRSHGPIVRCSGKGKPSSFVPNGYFSVSRSRSVCHLWNGTSHLGGKRATAEPFDRARRGGGPLVGQSLGYTENFESHRNSH